MRRIRACAVVVLLAGLLAPAAQSPVVAAGPTARSAPCPVSADAPKRQVRGDWIATVANIDWPSKPGLTPQQQKAELVGLYDEAVSRGLNTVVLQVRPTADTFWPSRYEPWSKYLTGTPGQDPGYDPLRFAVREAHARNLELHAWFNPYRVSMDTDRSALPANSPAAEHPDWVKAYGGKLYYDPGLPQVRSLVEHVVMDVVDRYDVDGVHFDDYFYPYPVAGQVFDDDATFAAHGDGFPDTAQGRADWRRHNNDLLVSQLDRKIHRAKPWVKFGVSPFGVWRNQATDPQGSATTAGAQTYDDLYADTRKWVRKGWLDYIAPQVYWALGFAPADYAVLVPWWADQVRGTGVQLYIGQATYKVGASTQSPAWNDDPREISNHLTFNRSYPEVDGDIYFSAKDVRANRLGHMDIVQREHYAHPAIQPVTSGVPGHRPPAVRHLVARRGAHGVRLSWRGRGSSYAVYRVGGGRVGRCDTADATHLVATVHGAGRLGHWVDTAAPAGRSTYVVTALDRAYRESRPGRPATVRGAR
jgi:uncharacterized lipoprotein YddW (UPF0748 family)